jgi:predicted protein tyrosine phosphatase
MAAVDGKKSTIKVESRPWRKKLTGPPKKPLTPLQVARRVALYELYVAQELVDAQEEDVHVQNHLSSLRKLVTNQETNCSIESIQESSHELKRLLRECGLGKEFGAKLKLDEPSKYDLVHKILPGLFCGGWAALNNNCFVLQQKGVTHVLSVHSADTQRNFPSFIEGSMLVTVNDEDDADIGQHFEAMCDFIDTARKQGGCVYVHCGAGISRAPTTCIAYVMKSGNLPLQAAFALVKRNRPCTRPNPGFLEQLRQWEQAKGEREPLRGGIRGFK